MKLKLLAICIIIALCLQSCWYKIYYNASCDEAHDKDYQGALQDFTLSITYNNKYYPAYNNRGNCYSMLGNIDSAITDYNTTISLNKNYYIAYDNRGMCKESLGDISGALADYYKVIEINKRFKMVYTHIARLLADIDSCGKSLYYLNIAIKRKAFDHCNSSEELEALKEMLEKKCR